MLIFPGSLTARVLHALALCFALRNASIAETVPFAAKEQYLFNQQSCLAGWNYGVVST